MTHGDTLEALPTRSPVASRMAIVLGTATSKAAREIKDKMITIAAHDLGVNFFDTAEVYGTEAVVGEAARQIGRRAGAPFFSLPVQRRIAKHRR